MSKANDKKRANSILSQRVINGNREYTVHGVGTLTLYPDKVSAVCRAYAMGHGFDQRVRDAAALSANRDTGKSATPQEKYDAMKRIVDHLNSGTDEWQLKPAATGGLDAGLVIMALTRVFAKSIAANGLDPVTAAENMVASMMVKRNLDRAGSLKLWASSKQVAATMLEIKAERLNSEIDADDLLEEMMGDEDGGDGEEEDELDEEDDVE